MIHTQAVFLGGGGSIVTHCSIGYLHKSPIIFFYLAKRYSEKMVERGTLRFSGAKNATACLSGAAEQDFSSRSLCAEAFHAAQPDFLPRWGRATKIPGRATTARDNFTSALPLRQQFDHRTASAPTISPLRCHCAQQFDLRALHENCFNYAQHPHQPWFYALRPLIVHAFLYKLHFYKQQYKAAI